MYYVNICDKTDAQLLQLVWPSFIVCYILAILYGSESARLIQTLYLEFRCQCRKKDKGWRERRNDKKH